MPRIRTIKPEFFRSETVAQLPLAARLTFIGLWTEADDWGRAVDNAKILKGALWPLDDEVTATDVSMHLHALCEAGLIERYEVDTRRYLRICGWDEHQSINRRSSPKHPAPPGSEPDVSRSERRSEGSVRAHGVITEGSLQERKGTGNMSSSSRGALQCSERPSVDNPMRTKTTTSEGDRATTALRLLATRLAADGQVTRRQQFAAAVVRNAVQLPELDSIARASPELEPEEIVNRFLAANRTPANRPSCTVCGATTHDASRCMLADPEEIQ